MLPSDITELSRRLCELADALNGKHPTSAAMKVWFDALQDVAVSDVLHVLTEWPKTHVKPPVPAEVLRLCRDRITNRIEESSKANAVDARKDWKPEHLRGDPQSPQYLAFKAEFAPMRLKRIHA